MDSGSTDELRSRHRRTAAAGIPAAARCRRRWSAMEKAAAEGGEALDALPLDAQEALWQAAKQTERGNQP